MMDKTRSQRLVSVRTEELKRLLSRLGDSSLWSWMCDRLHQGSLTRAERDFLIEALLSYKNKVTLQEIADCFDLSREAIRYIAGKSRISVVRVDNQRKWAERHIRWLISSPEGQQLVADVLWRIAQDKAFWAFSGVLNRRQGCLRKVQVLQALGFPSSCDELRAHCWKLLEKHGIVQDEYLVGFILRALGEEPISFFVTHYYQQRGARLEDVCRTINERAARKGLLQIGGVSTLQYYLEHHLEMPRKSKHHCSQ